MENDELEKMYNEVKQNYNAGTFTFSVDLAKARQVLMQINYKPIMYFYYAMYIFVFICCIASFFVLGWFGILYSIIYWLIWFSSLGSCSLPNSSGYGKSIIFTGIIFLIIAALFFDINMVFLVIISFIGLYLPYYFYRFSAKCLIDNFILKDVNYFLMWINDVFYIK